MTNNPLKLLFLDWKQAFDSLDHNAMLSTLGSLLSPAKVPVVRGSWNEKGGLPHWKCTRALRGTLKERPRPLIGRAWREQKQLLKMTGSALLFMC